MLCHSEENIFFNNVFSVNENEYGAFICRRLNNPSEPVVTKIRCHSFEIFIYSFTLSFDLLICPVTLWAHLANTQLCVSFYFIFVELDCFSGYAREDLSL